jgi:hypothetical protein
MYACLQPRREAAGCVFQQLIRLDCSSSSSSSSGGGRLRPVRLLLLLLLWWRGLEIWCEAAHPCPLWFTCGCVRGTPRQASLPGFAGFLLSHLRGRAGCRRAGARTLTNACNCACARAGFEGRACVRACVCGWVASRRDTSVWRPCALYLCVALSLQRPPLLMLPSG